MEKLYPLTMAQNEIYIGREYFSIENTFTVSVIFKGHVNKKAALKAAKILIDNNCSLRTCIIKKDETAYQIFNETDTFLKQINIIQFNDEEQYNTWADSYAKESLKLGLFELYIVDMCSEFSILLKCDHTISDGISQVLYIKQFKDIYDSIETNNDIKFNHYDYTEYIKSEELYLNDSEAYRSDYKYWKDRIANGSNSCFSFGNTVYKLNSKFNATRISREIENNLSNRVKQFCSIVKVSEPAIFLSAIAISYSIVFQNDMPIVDFVNSNRRTKKEQLTTGSFASTLPLNCGNIKELDITPVSEYIKYMWNNIFHMIQHSRFGKSNIRKLVDEFNNEQSIISDFSFSFQDLTALDNGSVFELYFSGQQIEPLVIHVRRDSKFGLKVLVDYRNVFYQECEINRLLDLFLSILEKILVNPNIYINELGNASLSEQEKILCEFNDTEAEFLEDKTVVDLFEEQVDKTPDNIALMFEEESMTYVNLNEKANQLAHKLRSLGVGADDFVAIMAERSMEMIVGILGIVKAGGVYVPIDSEYPTERVNYMLVDCKPKAILVYGKEIPEGIDIPILDLAKEDTYSKDQINPERINKPNDLIYTIYTSGTTGIPKGAMIEHKSVVNLVRNNNYTELNERTNLIQTGQISFDASTFEIWGCFLNGGKLNIIRKSVLLNPKVLKSYIYDNQINTMFMTTTLFNQMLEEDITFFDPLEHLLVGGEKLSEKHIKSFREHNQITHLENGYGPTETTTFAVHYNIEEVKFPIPIGSPIRNAYVYILNGEKLCGIGVPGELCITGKGVARGYLNQPELTKEKFVINPFGEGRMYRTGDLARWLPDGNIEYLGRMDEQVKIRGFRIELGEVEGRLREIENIRDCAVVAKVGINGDKAICAYVVSDQDINVRKIKEDLAKNLPDYMLPQYIMQIEKIPVTRNGKLDKRALPNLEFTSIKEYVAPETDEEKAITNAFQEILGFKSVGIDDDFFEMGGDSIKAIRVVSKIREKGYDLEVKDVLLYRTARALSEKLTVSRNDTYEQDELTGKVELTPIQREFFNMEYKKPNHFNQALVLNCKEPIDYRCLEATLKAVVSHHDMLRSVYNGGEQKILSVADSKLFMLAEYDIKETEDYTKRITEVCGSIQAGIDLEGGPLFKAALFHTFENDYLFLCIHHLVIDGISWRILLEDMENVYYQVREGREIELPRKTASYKEWSENLSKRTKEGLFDDEVQYWDKITKGMRDRKIFTDLKEVKVTIDEKETEHFIKDCTKAFGTEINDLLLTALSHAYRNLTGEKYMTVDLEGHGREVAGVPLAIDRTVGWFTSIYPVRVQVLDDMSDSIIETKETLRMIPNHGIGYGALTYLSGNNKDNEERKSDICFNYLGDFGVEEENLRMFSFSKISSGNIVAIENGQTNAISVYGGATKGKITFIISYAIDVYDEEKMKIFANDFNHAIEEVIKTCMNQKEPVKTASDYGVKGVSASEIKKIVKRHGKIDHIYHLTPMQKGMLYHKLIDEAATSYVIQTVFAVKGKMNAGLIRESLQCLSNKHEMLKAFIMTSEENELYLQVIPHERDIELNEVTVNSKEEIEELKQSDINRGFDLSKDSLLRLTLIHLSANEHVILWSAHHIIMDGWCMSIVFGDFMSYYNRLAAGISYDVLKVEIESEENDRFNFCDYVSWIEKHNNKQALNYWEDMLDGYDEAVTIPPLQPKNNNKTESRTKEIYLKKTVTDDLKKMATEQHVTLNTVVEAAWGILLQKYNYCDDVVFGKVVSGRNAELPGIEKAIGLFINTIPSRVVSEAGETIVELVANMQKQALASMKYEYSPLMEIQSRSLVGRNLIQTLFVFENYYIDEEAINEGLVDLNFTLEESREEVNYAMSMTVSMPKEELSLKLMYDASVYTDEEAVSVLEHLEKLLEQMSVDQNVKVSDLEIVTESERDKITGEFNETKAEFPEDKTVVELFEEQVENSPENIALIYEEESMTYAELNEKANQLAHKLRSIGVKPDDFVAIMAKRSIEMFIGIYGIIKAGGAYVPIDPEYPMERINYILNDCKPKAILVYGAGIPEGIETPILDLVKEDTFAKEKSNPKHINTPNDLIYMIYTSGTTGNPKGVMNLNMGLINRITWMNNRYPLLSTDAVLQKTTYTFDVSVWEIIWWGIVGAKVVILKAGSEKSPEEIMNAIDNHKITHLHFVPSMLAAFLDNLSTFSDDIIKLKTLRYIFASGEALSVSLLKEFNDLVRSKLKETRLINFYGPTEASIDVSYFDCENDYSCLPIGKPIDNTKLYIIESNHLCGIGMPGELCITGKGLARGYLNQPELTEEKFVINPFGEGRMYHTGDLARWRPDGNIEYLGRIDDQVKIRGFRIELGEIEDRLREIENVRDCAVVAKTDISGEKAICAYVVSDQDIDARKIKEELAKNLPDYMLPPYIMQIEKIPVTRNGKLDKRALPNPEFISIKEYIAPETDEEKAITDALQEILGVKSVGVDDDFFEMGGDSIKAIRVVSRIREKGYNLAVKDVIQYRTVRTMSDKLTVSGNDTYEQGELTGKVELTPIQHEFFNMGYKKPNHFNHALVLNCKERIDYRCLEAAIKAVVSHHDMLRSVYHDCEQEILSVADSKLFMLAEYDISEAEDYTKRIIELCTSIQAGLNLEEGPLFNAILFHTFEHEYLFLCIHHLVIDGVSWRILLEDMENAYYQAKEGREIELPRKTASYKEWSENLSWSTKEGLFDDEVEYWDKITKGMRDGKIFTDLKEIKVTIDEKETEHIIKDCTKAFGTEINDLLLTALAHAYKNLTGERYMTAELEGHGREVAGVPMAIDRTVGWFTSIYPVRVQVIDNMSDSIIETKETLRMIPNHGIGYGALKYLRGNNKDNEERKSDICFNYMGDFGAEEEKLRMFSFTKIASGRAVAIENGQINAISVNGIATKGKMTFTISYATDVYGEEEMRTFTKDFKQAIDEVIKTCMNQKGPVKTASDYGAKGVSQEALEELQDFLS